MILWSFVSTILSVNEITQKINMTCFPHSMSLISVCQLKSYFSQRQEAVLRPQTLNKSSPLIQLTGFFTLENKFLPKSLTTTFKAATWMLARLWFKFCCQNFRPLLTKENAGIPSSARERTATTELQRPQLSPPCSFCLLIACTS